MNLRIFTLGVLGAVAALVTFSGPASAADRPYTEGTVSNVSSIHTEPGMFDDYMAYIAGTYKPMMEAQKAAGIIVDYQVYTTTPRGPEDPDIYLVTVYRNMAALDDLRDRVEPIQQKLLGDMAQRQAATVARGKLRTLVGSQLLRKLELK
jgi:hypothetical protein